MYYSVKSANKIYPSYENKAKVLETGLDKEEKLLKSAIAHTTGKIKFEIEQVYIGYLYSNPLWQEAQRVNCAASSRRKRLDKRIYDFLLSGNCIFLTLTFTDEVLQTTSEETRRKYVTRYLKEHSSRYVANIDYGEKNEREHYHAVIQCDSVSHEKWLYGAINFKRIRKTSDSTKLAKYVVKLTNHAIKKTVKRNHTIYSRNV